MANGTITAGSMGKLLDILYKDYTTGREERKERYGAGLSEMAQAAGLFGPGYGAGMEQTALAGARQSLIGRGLGGTTRPMAVGAGMKAQFEDLRRGRLATALQQMAGYRATFPETTATAGVLSHLATGGFGGMLGEKKLALQAAGAGLPYGGTATQPVRTYGGTYGAVSFPDMFSIPGELGFGGVGAPDFQQPASNGGGYTRGRLSPAAEMFQTAAVGEEIKPTTTTTVTTETGPPETGMVKNYYGNWTWGPTSYSESIAFSKWMKKQGITTPTDADKKRWRQQYNV